MKKDPFTSAESHLAKGFKVWLLAVVIAIAVAGVMFFPFDRTSFFSSLKTRPPKQEIITPATPLSQPATASPQPAVEAGTTEEKTESVSSLPVEAPPFSKERPILGGKLLAETKAGKKVFILELSETSINQLLQDGLFKEPVSTIQLQDKGLLPEEWINQTIQVVGILTVSEDPAIPPIFEVQQATLIP